MLNTVYIHVAVMNTDVLDIQLLLREEAPISSTSFLDFRKYNSATLSVLWCLVGKTLGTSGQQVDSVLRKCPWIFVLSTMSPLPQCLYTLPLLAWKLRLPVHPLLKTFIKRKKKRILELKAELLGLGIKSCLKTILPPALEEDLAWLLAEFEDTASCWTTGKGTLNIAFGYENVVIQHHGEPVGPPHPWRNWTSPTWKQMQIPQYLIKIYWYCQGQCSF